MEMWDIDMKVSTYLQRREYEEAESLLQEQYSKVKTAGNPTAIRHILNGIANFYCLPFKKDLSRAESYYREMEALFPDRETDFRFASFYFYSLKDFSKRVDKIQSMAAPQSQGRKDFRFYYSALTLKGQALLHLNRNHEATLVLRELANMTDIAPNYVPYGDEFNFLSEMTRRKLELELCKQLATAIVSRVRDQEFKDKFLTMLKELGG